MSKSKWNITVTLVSPPKRCAFVPTSKSNSEEWVGFKGRCGAGDGQGTGEEKPKVELNGKKFQVEPRSRLMKVVLDKMETQVELKHERTVWHWCSRWRCRLTGPRWIKGFGIPGQVTKSMDYLEHQGTKLRLDRQSSLLEPKSWRTMVELREWRGLLTDPRGLMRLETQGQARESMKPLMWSLRGISPCTRMRRLTEGI